MTDFVRDLDEQLVAAARRRAQERAGGARRWRRSPWRPAPGRLAVAMTTLVALALAGAALATLARDGGDAGGERVAGGPPPVGEAGPPLTLGSPGTFTACADKTLGRPVPSGGEPAATLGVLEQGRRASDAPPRLKLPDGRMLAPITTYRPSEVRRIDPPIVGGREDIEAWLVPTAGVRAASCGARRLRDPDPGACLVARRGAFLSARCWTLAQIRAGRAFTLIAPRAVVLGLVADDVASVEARRTDMASGLLAVADRNAVGFTLPRARRGTELAITLRRQSGPRVAFLNGTVDEGAARAAERRLRESGWPFRTDVVGSAALHTAETSRVYWTGRHERTAVEVSGRLGIGDLGGAAPEEVRMLAPKAQVIVVIGRGTGGATSDAPGHSPDTGAYAPPPEHKGGGQ